jgi:sec-independent protein translocase protein TatB
MLFDLGWSEILLIGTVALIFIGPKDLPKALRVAGFWVRKARTLSREFQSSIDQMIREAELDEMRQDLKKATEFDLEKEFHNTIDPTGSLKGSLKAPELPNFSSLETSAPQIAGGDTGAPTTAGATEAAAPPQIASAEIAGMADLAAQPGAKSPEIPGPPAMKASLDDITHDIVPPQP